MVVITICAVWIFQKIAQTLIPLWSMRSCPTIAIGDGGNEIGMGNIAETLSQLDIRASKTHCDELLVADVSNWAAHGLIALLAVMAGQRPAGGLE